MELKDQIQEECLRILNEKIKSLQKNLSELRNSLENETKSSAGDKYETGREMLAAEQAGISSQLDELLKQKAILQSVLQRPTANLVMLGSLVETNRGFIFVSVPIGQVSVQGQVVYVISPHSPLGMKLLGLKKDHILEVNTSIFRIKEIY